MGDKTTFTSAAGRTKAGVFVAVLLVFIAVTIGIVVWQTQKLYNERDKAPEPHGSGKSFGDWPIQLQNLKLTADFHVSLKDMARTAINGYLNYNHTQTGSSAVVACKDQSSKVDMCLEWPGDKRLTINHSHLLVNRSMNSHLDCYDIEWKALRCHDQVLTDCFNVSEHHWFGGYADKFQYWPFQRNTRPISAYVVNDSYQGEIGGVIERYWFSSAGIGVFVDHDVPLYFSLHHPNNDLMCLSAKYDDYPYKNTKQQLPELRYKICQGKNAKDIHIKMSSLFIKRPNGIPDEKLFKYPIWSTWAQYHKEINQSTVIGFANDILKHNFTHAQIEIDDDWTPKYGDMTFNTQKFPDPRKMVETLNLLGFRVTVWVHPFFNLDSQSFNEAALNNNLVRQYDGRVPAMTPWWDGLLAGILDVSNETSVDWFLAKLELLKANYNISSFKFDAGETSWMPHIYSIANRTLNPTDAYPIKWVELAARADTSFHQEVRVGYKTQEYPIFVRMMDKLSNWGHENAYKSIIPCVLTYGLLGYPFVLPDMIGGNAYNGHPDPELFIRWLQLNTFLPSMQFSIVPWMYNETIVQIAQKFTKIHERFSDVFIKYAHVASSTGEPIIRPLWWNDPNDIEALTNEDEFYVGDEILVAPIMAPGARKRDIYFPSGQWKDQTNNDTITGPHTLNEYPVAIDELAFFIRA